MISQSLYLDLQVMASEYQANHPDIPVDIQFGEFIHPYILVIHQPTKRGFYISGDFKCIISVSDCQGPSNFVKMTRQFLPKGYILPAWANRVDSLGLHSEEFDTFWLY